MNNKKNSKYKDNSKKSDKIKNHKPKILEKIPNDNLYKSDKYKMNFDLSFEACNDEDNYIRDQALRYKDLNSKLLNLGLISLFIYTLTKYHDISMIYMIFLLIFYLIGCVYVNIFMPNIKIESNIFERIKVEIFILIFVFIRINNIEFDFEPIFFFYLLQLIFNLTHAITMKQSLYLYINNTVIILFSHGHLDYIFFSRLIINIISHKFFVIMSVNIFTLIVHYFMKKGEAELWALYDSFKRSYHILHKNLYEDSPFPIFIISKPHGGNNNKQIYYRNELAMQLYNNTKIQQKQKQETRAYSRKDEDNKISFDDMFDKELKVLFEHEIEKCLTNNLTYIKFPFKINTMNKDNSPMLKYKENTKGSTYYEGDLDSYEWYKIIISPCFWKTQEAIFLKLIKHNDFYINEFITNYTNNINFQFSTLLESIDKFCDKITEYDSIQRTNVTESKLTNQSASANSKQLPRKPALIYGKTSSEIKNVNLSFIKEPVIDDTTWFFYRFNTNYIYDMYLTIRVYNALVYSRFHPPENRVNIPEFVNYFKDYFYIHSKAKKFNIEFLNKIEDEVVIHYDYIRTIFFNVILFILNNSNEENREKFLKIKIYNSQHFIDKEYLIRVEISYIDDKPKIKYNSLLQLLKLSSSIHSREELKKASIIDIGIMVVHYLTTLVYDNRLECSTNENNFHFINFTLKCFKSGPTEKSTLNLIKLKSSKIKISTEHYNKILKYVYHLNKDEKKLDSRFTDDDDEEDEIYDPDEDRNLSYEKDRINTLEFAIELNKHFENYEHLFKIQNKRKEDIIKKSQNKKYKPLLFNKVERIYWDNNKIQNNMKFFYPPRFLIVEDNAFGRNNLIEILKQQKLDFLVDIAACGLESIQKFKFFMNKGFLYDIIFMDINLPDMLGTEVAITMRNYENEFFKNIRTNIIAVSVEGKMNIKIIDIFDHYFEKPLKKKDLSDYILRHYEINRPEVFKQK